MTTENMVPVKCNGCKHMYYVEPEKAKQACDLCGNPDVQILTKTNANELFKMAMSKSMKREL